MPRITQIIGSRVSTCTWVLTSKPYPSDQGKFPGGGETGFIEVLHGRFCPDPMENGEIKKKEVNTAFSY